MRCLVAGPCLSLLGSLVRVDRPQAAAGDEYPVPIAVRVHRSYPCYISGDLQRGNVVVLPSREILKGAWHALDLAL